jgi:hypothetical protein
VRQGGDLKANRAAFVPWNKNNNHWTLWVVFGHGKHMDYYEPMSENVDEADRVRKRSMLDYASAMAGSNVSSVRNILIIYIVVSRFKIIYRYIKIFSNKY